MNQPSINRPGASLSDSALTICAACGRPVWVYPTPVGDRVTLEDLPGEFLIDGRGKAYRSTRPDGYRLHNPDCQRVARASLSGAVTLHEFLWI
jgi:hypothetical protein